MTIGASDDAHGGAAQASIHQQANQALQAASRAELAGDLATAVTLYQEVIRLVPGIYEVHNNLAGLLLGLGRAREARQEAEAAFALNPECPLVNANLGQARVYCNMPDQAIPNLELALAKNPALHPLRPMLANILLEQGRHPDAVTVLRPLQEKLPDDVDMLNTMARFYHRARMAGDAERCYLRILELDPKKAGACNDLATVYLDHGQFSKGREFARRGLQLEPDSPVLWNTLANAEQCVGLMDQAIQSYRKVVELDPRLAVAHSNLLLSMHYVSGLDPAGLFAEHLRWASMHAPPERASTTFTNQPEPGRRLRIGYMSPDIRRHSVAFFLEPLLDHSDSELFELFCYADVKAPDEFTARLRNKFDHYRNILDMRDAAIADLIKADEIDILIDLAGHTGSHHAAVLGYKPAPVQVTYLGYPDTTGISAVDYRITDRLSDPPGAEATHVERLVRLPRGFLCYRPLEDLPALGDAPHVKNGCVTFGSFNREFKVSQLTFDLWARILQSTPGSRMIMKSVAGNDPETREFQVSQFEKRGIDRDRIRLVGLIQDHREHLASYRQVDIALDTFPYHGTTTTLDSLVMGVPVITQAGYHHASRVGASLLTQAGIPECIARSDDEYVARAISLAKDPARISQLHGRLRDQLLASSLCDGPGFTRDFEAALKGMWYGWCRQQGRSLSASQAALADFDFAAAGIAGDLPPAR